MNVNLKSGTVEGIDGIPTILPRLVRGHRTIGLLLAAYQKRTSKTDVYDNMRLKSRILEDKMKQVLSLLYEPG
jgi:hypothetical protein